MHTLHIFFSKFPIFYKFSILIFFHVFFLFCQAFLFLEYQIFYLFIDFILEFWMLRNRTRYFQHNV